MTAPLILVLLAALAQDPQAEPPSTDQGEEADVIGELLGEDSAHEAAAPPTEPTVAPPAPVYTPPVPPPGPRPFEMPAAVPIEPVPYAPQVVLPTEPVSLDGYRRQYEPPPDVIELRYARGVEETADRAQDRFGPLDGLWRVTMDGGAPLLMLALHDPGAFDSEIEGAWRDLRRRGAVGASGVLVSCTRDGGALTIMYYEPGATEPSTLRLFREPDERWRGVLQTRAGASVPVLMSPA